MHGINACPIDKTVVFEMGKYAWSLYTILNTTCFNSFLTITSDISIRTLFIRCILIDMNMTSFGSGESGPRMGGRKGVVGDW